jgi:hypothetical protein
MLSMLEMRLKFAVAASVLGVRVVNYLTPDCLFVLFSIDVSEIVAYQG